MWYERAKLAGFKNSRGSTTKIFNRLSNRDRAFAVLQLTEDIEQFKSVAASKKGQPGYTSQDFERIKLHILRQQNDFNFFKNKRHGGKSRKKAAARR